MVVFDEMHVGRAVSTVGDAGLPGLPGRCRCAPLCSQIPTFTNLCLARLANSPRGEVNFCQHASVVLRWYQVDLLERTLTVGKSKSAAGTGRVVPLNPRAAAVLTHWHGQFPGAEPEHYVFPSEKYGLAGNDRLDPFLEGTHI
jgi:hypothetical protein